MFTYGMTHELNEKMTGGRITKIHQPYKHDVIFHIRVNGKTKTIIIGTPELFTGAHHDASL